jgi:PAP_fibrillin
MITIRIRNVTTSMLLLLLLLLGRHHPDTMTFGFVVVPIVTTTSTTRIGRTCNNSNKLRQKYDTILQQPHPPSTAASTVLYASRDANVPGTKTSASSSTSSKKEVLLDLILKTPAGRATSAQLTQQILQQIQSLSCPTPDTQVLTKLSGSWELLWTAQDPSQPESQRWNNRIINPIENQSFSNNPEGSGGGNNNSNNNMGRSNPFLPMGVQNLLEQLGIVSSGTSSTTRRSTQAIDIKTRTIRNIVSIQFNTNYNNSNNNQPRFFGASSSSSTPSQSPRRVSLTVTVKFTPVQSDARRVNVKFTECRISIPSLVSSSRLPPTRNNNFEYTFPLGLIGPTGWLRTIYIDDTLRITRGHKGSVFVLARPRRATV